MKQFRIVLLASMVIFFTACGGSGGESSSQDSSDTTSPVITVNGNNPEEVTQGNTYTDAGATAIDDKDGSVTVITTGSVNTSAIGTYTLTYTATDSASNTATKTRTVNVVAPPASLIIPVVYMGDENTVRYFTFLNEKVLMTRGCVNANLYDDNNIPLDDPWIATEGNYTYIARKTFIDSYTSYGIVYAKSMDIEPKPLMGGATYFPASGIDIKKLVINETTTLLLTASKTARTLIYNSNLDFIDTLSPNSPKSIGPGTYYLLITNGLCRESNLISLDIL